MTNWAEYFKRAAENLEKMLQQPEMEMYYKKDGKIGFRRKK